MTGRQRQTILWVVVAAGLVLGVFTIVRWVGGSNQLVRDMRERTMIDAQTGEVFEDFRVPSGEPYPLTNPKTRTASLFPAERCHWNADGTARLAPTYVLLNVYTSSDEPTVCPDCGREVVAHNPTPPDELMMDAAQRAQQGG